MPKPVSRLFERVGCSDCHVASITTAPPGHGDQWRDLRDTSGARQQRSSIPFSDFLLHDIKTGDGIVPGPGRKIPLTNCVRRPFGGLRMRPRLWHDHQSLTLENAIRGGHKGEG